MNYLNQLNQTANADEFILTQKEDMKKNLAGGVSFKADKFSSLNRWLFAGSFDNAFYETKESITSANFDTLKDCITENPVKVAELILNASNKGTMKSQHTCILALVFLSMGDEVAKNEYKRIFNSVVRTASHLYEFVAYVKQFRGTGTIIKKSVNNWILNNKDLEYQFLKYQQRNTFSNRDILRIFKPVPRNEVQDSLFSWVVGKEKPIHESLKRIDIYEKLKLGQLSNKEVVDAIIDLGLTQEMIPSNIERDESIWSALFLKMPITATLRNLPTLTRKGILKGRMLNVLEERFSKDNLQKSRLHPLEIANALKFYSSGGTLGKSKGEIYAPINFVVDLLDESITNAFENVEPTGLNFFHALDISGSMTMRESGNLSLSPMEVETIMALSTIKSEKDYFIGGFSNNFKPLDFFKRTSSLKDTFSNMNGLNFGGTNAGSAYKYAIDNKMFTDVFVFWTDNENWSGSQPSQLLEEYRNRINPNVKAIYITLAPYSDNITLANPKDKLSFDIAGFSTDTPKLISLLSSGSV